MYLASVKKELSLRTEEKKPADCVISTTAIRILGWYSTKRSQFLCALSSIPLYVYDPRSYPPIGPTKFAIRDTHLDLTKSLLNISPKQ